MVLFFHVFAREDVYVHVHVHVGDNVHHDVDSSDQSDHGSGWRNPCADECACTRRTPKNFPPSRLLLNAVKLYY